MPAYYCRPSARRLSPDYRDYLRQTIHRKVRLGIFKSRIPNAGLGIFVREDVLAGTELFRVMQPLNTTFNQENVEKACDNCSTSSHECGPGNSITSCDGCHRVRYCSLDCKNEAWETHHRHECNTALQTQCTSPELAMTLRLYNRMKHGGDAHGSFREHDQEAIERLAFPAIDRSDPIVWPGGSEPLLSVKVAKVTADLAAVDPTLDKTYFSLIYSKVLLNSMQMQPPEIAVPIGACLDAYSSIINHSCARNTYCFAEGDQLRFRTLKDMKAGDEVFISYVQPSQPLELRRGHLDNWYLLHCDLCELETAETDRYVPTRLTAESIRKAVLQCRETVSRLVVTNDAGDDDIGAAERSDQLTIDGLVEVLRRECNDSGWPETLHPIPETLEFLVNRMGASQPEAALKVMLKQCLVIRPQIGHGTVGDFWVKALRSLVDAMIGFEKLSNLRRQDSADGPDSFHTLEIGKELLQVYIAFLVQESDWWYGKDTKFSQANRHLLEGHTYWRNSEMRERDWVIQFYRKQDDLLTWAGVETDRGIVVRAETFDLP